jgi:predicted nucleic acid-binding protein
MRPIVVVDTNLFVAAGFRPGSTSGRLLEAIRSGRVRMAWNEATRRETERVVRKIPPLAWERCAPLFRDEDRCDLETHPEAYAFVPDPDDRKFAALAEACAVPLVTSDEHLLGVRHRLGVPVLTPAEWSTGYDLSATEDAPPPDPGG